VAPGRNLEKGELSPVFGQFNRNDIANGGNCGCHNRPLNDFIEVKPGRLNFINVVDPNCNNFLPNHG
jgi:hypothetical protein